MTRVGIQGVAFGFGRLLKGQLGNFDKLTVWASWDCRFNQQGDRHEKGGDSQ
jgi:hypothetical protein